MVTLQDSRIGPIQMRACSLLFLLLLTLTDLFAQGKENIKFDSTRMAHVLRMDHSVDRAMLKVKNTDQFIKWTKINRPHWLLKQIGSNLIEVSGLKDGVSSEFDKVPFLEFVDRAARKAKEETVLGDFDYSLNAITASHSFYPGINGSEVKISVKEKPFNVDDIDLRGRIALNNQFDEPFTQHATFMATIAAGGGNTSVFARGAAWASLLTTSDFSRLLPDDTQTIISQGITVQNHSYGVGVENYYGIESSEYDQQVIDLPYILHVFSSGNEGTQAPGNGSYAGIKGYANLTGQFKVSKNTLAVGSSDRFGNVVAASSRGPAHDGRIKPELIAFGDAGSSESAALVSGVALLVQDAYKKKYSSLPDAALVKSVLINGAQDSGRPHVDFETGFGSVNALNAIRTIEENRFYSGSVMHDAEEIVTITVPPNQHELKLTLAWSDVPANPLVSKALINDLDFTLHSLSTGEVWHPWVLDSTPSQSAVVKEAVRGVDRINNVEQITLTKPETGTYELRVKGFSIPHGPQKFFISYDLLEGMEWLYPVAGTAMPAGRENIIRWNWQGDDQEAEIAFRYLPDGEWQTLSDEVVVNNGYYQWDVPDTSAQVQLRLSTLNNIVETSPFVISKTDRLKVGFNCSQEVMLTWNKVPNAQSYILYMLGEKYLEPFVNGSDTFAIINKNQVMAKHFTVVPVINGLSGARELTINYEQQGVGCYIISFSPQQYLVNDVARFDLLLGTTYKIKSVSLERMEAGLYKPIQTISSINSTSILLSDANPLSGNNYYRARLEHEEESDILSSQIEIVYVTSSDLIVFPNPVVSGEELNVIIENEQDATLRIFDMYGRLIRGAEDFGTVRNIDTSNLMAGIYFLKVYKSDGTTLIKRFMIQ
jgi:hypothetical protein